MSENNDNKALRWKQNRQVFQDVQFPSGCVADIQRVSTTSMIAEDGHIPDSFYSSMMAVQENNNVNMDAHEAKEFMQTMMYVTKKAAQVAFVSPKIVDEPNYEVDEIAIDDLTDADRMFLWNWLTGGGEPADALRRFLAAQQNGSVAAASSMPKVRAVAGTGDGHNG